MWSPAGTGVGTRLAASGGRGCPDCGTPFQPGDRACGRCGRQRASGEDTIVATTPVNSGPQPVASLRRPLLAGPTAAPAPRPSGALPSAAPDAEDDDGEPAWEGFGAARRSAADDDRGAAGETGLEAEGTSIVSGHRLFVAALVAIIAALLIGGLVLVSRRRPTTATQWRFGEQAPLPSGIHQRPTLRWRTNLAAQGPFALMRSGVLQDDTHVYAAYRSGVDTFITALDRRSGAVVWTATDVGPSPFVQLVGGRLVVSQSRRGSGPKPPFALDLATGQVAWTLTGQTAFAFSDAGPLLVVRDNTLVIVDPVTGTDRWSTSLGVDFVPSAGVFIRRQCDAVSATDWTTGVELWTAKQQNDPCGTARTVPAVTVGADVVIFADGQELVGVDRLTGAERWRGPSPAPIDSLEMLGKDVAVGRRNDDKEVFAVDAHTGEPVFDGTAPDGRMLSVRSANRDTLLLAGDRGLLVLDPVTFAPVGDPRPVDADEQTGGLMLAADTTYKLDLGLGSRALTAYDLQSGAVRWRLEISDGSQLVSAGRTLVVAEERGLAAYG